MNKIIVAYKRGYRCTNSGKLINPQGNNIGFVTDIGYIATSIRINGLTTAIHAHRLQAYQKFGDSLFKEGIEVRHLDGDRKNFTWGNISIGTHSDNMMDIPEHIRLANALYATSFVRKHDKKAIKEFHATCNSYKSTMAKFNITSKGTLNYILNN